MQNLWPSPDLALSPATTATAPTAFLEIVTETLDRSVSRMDCSFLQAATLPHSPLNSRRVTLLDT